MDGNQLNCNCSLKGFADWAKNLSLEPSISCRNGGERSLSKINLTNCGKWIHVLGCVIWVVEQSTFSSLYLLSTPVKGVNVCDGVVSSVQARAEGERLNVCYNIDANIVK